MITSVRIVLLVIIGSLMGLAEYIVASFAATAWISFLAGTLGSGGLLAVLAATLVAMAMTLLLIAFLALLLKG